MEFNLTRVASAIALSRGGADAPSKCDNRGMLGHYHDEIRRSVYNLYSYAGTFPEDNSTNRIMKIHIPIFAQVLFLGSLQAHCAKRSIRGGDCSTLGTTDLGLPKILIEYA